MASSTVVASVHEMRSRLLTAKQHK